MEIIDIYKYNDANKLQIRKSTLEHIYIRLAYIFCDGACIHAFFQRYMFTFISIRTSILYQDKYGKHKYVHSTIASITRRMTLYRHIPAESRQLI